MQGNVDLSKTRLDMGEVQLRASALELTLRRLMSYIYIYIWSTHS